MAKNSNPADAFRKAQRAKELKKNKEDRKKVRETQTIKRDTRELEADIRHLKTQTWDVADPASKTKLAELESELKYVNGLKEQYVKEHPEARDVVFRTRKPREKQEGEASSSTQQLYDESGRLRDPKRSVYYDEVYNPFGVPPPGMPYRERTPEAEPEEESEDGSDDEIVMPEGPPPQAVRGSDSDSDADSDDSDDIPLPEGPPPPRPTSQPIIPSGPPPPMRMGFVAGAPPMPFPPPPRPVPFHSVQYGQPPHPMVSGAGPGPSHFRPPMRPPRGHAPHHGPPPTVQDPLSDAPTQTYQGHRMAQHALPVRPSSGASAIQASAAPSSSAAAGPTAGSSAANTGEISAAPVMRDLRKEATVFVPRGVKRKKLPGGGAVGTINAAPGAGEIDEDGDERKRINSGGLGLMGKLEGLLGSAGQAGAGSKPGGSGADTADDEYQKFLDGLGDLS